MTMTTRIKAEALLKTYLKTVEEGNPAHEILHEYGLHQYTPYALTMIEKFQHDKYHDKETYNLRFKMFVDTMLNNFPARGLII